MDPPTQKNEGVWANKKAPSRKRATGQIKKTRGNTVNFDIEFLGPSSRPIREIMGDHPECKKVK